MFIWSQSKGTLHSTIADKNIGNGYSGAVGYKNDPEAQKVHNKGPIPQGEWGILGPPVDTATHGPYVIHLFAKPGTDTFGRSGFLIHGDSIEHPGQASEGCIILPRSVREFIWNSNDHDLQVVA